MVDWPGWMHPVREDIVMCAIDVRRGEYFDRYAEIDVVDVTRTRSRFATGRFDAVVAALVLEYVESPRTALRELARISRPGATLYIEHPAWHTPDLPRLATLAEFGIEAEPLNFFDDEDRLHLFDPARLNNELRAAGFAVLESGGIRNDRLAPELFRFGYHHKNVEILSYALRLIYGFASYVVARRIGQERSN